jgi:hypothetical protein
VAHLLPLNTLWLLVVGGVGFKMVALAVAVVLAVY